MNLIDKEPHGGSDDDESDHADHRDAKPAADAWSRCKYRHIELSVSWIIVSASVLYSRISCSPEISSFREDANDIPEISNKSGHKVRQQEN